MPNSGRLLFETDTAYDHYQVWDMIYDGRSARVIYSGSGQAAQSGIPLDGKPDMLFDYNQRFYELVAGLLPKRLLIIGGGMFTLPTVLLEKIPSVTIDVVEIDKGLTEIAENYFNLRPNERLQIFYENGLEYLQNHDTTYDLILVDAFFNLTIPESLITPVAVKLYAKHLTKNGILVHNVVSSYLGNSSSLIFNLAKKYEKVFSGVAIYPAGHGYSLWLPQNLILAAHKDAVKPLDEYVRYAALTTAEDPSLR